MCTSFKYPVFKVKFGLYWYLLVLIPIPVASHLETGLCLPMKSDQSGLYFQNIFFIAAKL